MADRRLTAHWAWISKQPGAVAYDVQATSSGKMDFGGYVGRYVTGLPKHGTPASAPGALPWVTFGPFVLSDDQVLVSVSVQDPPRDRDSASREIFPQRLFLLAYQDLVAVGASCRQLWAALAQIELPTADGCPVVIEVPEQPLGEVVGTIERFGVERMATLAAMILEDRLVLADSAALPRDERLALLDAAFALLPYGFRAAVSASSAVNNTVTHVIELVFAEFANDNNQQVIVGLSGAAPIPLPRTQLGLGYRDMLCEKARDPGLPALVEYLWGATQPCSLHGRQHEALRILGELDFEQSLIRALHNRTASKAHLFKLFSREPAVVESFWRSADLADAGRDAALAIMLGDPDEETTRALQIHWDTLTEELFVRASRDLDAGDPNFARWCLQSARLKSAEHEDYFLAELIASELVTAQARPRRMEALAELLGTYNKPRPEVLVLTRTQLCQSPDTAWSFQLVQNLLGGLVVAGDLASASSWAAWLCQPMASVPADLPPWATVLRVLYGRPPRERTVLDRTNLGWAGVLLRIASFNDHFPDTLAFVADDVLALAQSVAVATRKAGQPATSVAGVRFLLDSLDAGERKCRMSADLVARIDVARVMLGEKARGFPADAVDDRVVDGYLDGLNHELGLRLDPALHSWLAGHFLALIVPGGALSPGAVILLNNWSANPSLSPEVNRHIAGLTPGHRPVDDHLAADYWDSVAREPRLAGYASMPRLTVTGRKAAADPGRALARSTEATGVTSTPLALTCHSARRAGLSIGEMLRALAVAQVSQIPPRQLDDVLREFQGLLYYDQEFSGDGREDLFQCYASIVRGALGQPYGEMFRRELITRSRDDIELRKDLVQRLHGAGGADRPRAAGWRGLLAWLRRS